MVTENRFKRLWNHWILPNWRIQKHFPKALLKRTEHLIEQSENQHLGQLRFVIEASLPTKAVLQQVTPKERAKYYFSQLGVWDTQYNTGVLLYIGCADHALEIIADRGVSAKISDVQWQQVCAQLAQDFAQGRFELGLEQAIASLTQLLVAHIPHDGIPVLAQDQLSNEVLLR